MTNFKGFGTYNKADTKAILDKLEASRAARMCRCCGQWLSIGKDGLCIPCRVAGCWVWEFEPKVGVKA